MGSEEPRRGDRRYAAGFLLKQRPGKLSRKSISGSSAGVSSPRVPKAALTPISRLKKFQKLRDRNLRKEVLYRNNIRKHLKMLEDTEEQRNEAVVKSPQVLKDQLVKLENGEEKEIENGVKENGGNEINGISMEHDMEERNGVEENGEVRRSPRRSKGKETEVTEQLSVIEENTTLEEEHIEHIPEKEPSPEPEPKEIEVVVKTIESPASSSRRRSTPRRQEVSSTFFDKETTESSLRDLNWISDTSRISGRRPIRDFGSPRKRKSDEFVDEEPRSTKKMAFTPSVPSPGWRFLSPFSLFKKFPRTDSNRPVDDSLFVNVSSSDSDIDVELDNSMVSPLDESITEEIADRPTPQSPNKSTSWLCRLM